MTPSGIFVGMAAPKLTPAAIDLLKKALNTPPPPKDRKAPKQRATKRKKG